jgi:signal transduction histidine kinase
MPARLSLRTRLTVAFAAALMLVLALAGTFVYLQVRADLNESLDESLRVRADDVAALVSGGRTSEIRLDQQRIAESEEGFAQVLTSDGGVEAGSTLPPSAGAAIDPTEAAKAVDGPILFNERDVPGIAGRARILARPVDTLQGQGERTLVVVVGASTEDRDETLSGLQSAFLIGAPVAVLLISGLGYLLAGLAVAPVAAALEREREFVGDASHELRTPLAILKTEIELAGHEGRSAEELRGALRSAGEEVDRLSRLAEDLLVLARSDQGKLALRRERVDLKVLLERVRQRFARQAKRAGRELVVDAPATGVDLDPLRLEQALGNLVDNALRHGAGEVRLSARRNGERAVFEVSDDGAGFPPEFGGRAFERFTRADEGRTGGGAGLGLAIARAIAEAHGGEATASNGDPATIVRISVPA